MAMEKYTKLLKELDKKQAEMIVANLLFKNGKLYLPVQSDVETIALETLDNNRRIYLFDPIPLTNDLYLEYVDPDHGWEVKNTTEEIKNVMEEIAK